TGSSNEAGIDSRRCFPNPACDVGGGIDSGDKPAGREEANAISQQRIRRHYPWEVVRRIDRILARDASRTATDGTRTLQVRGGRILRRVYDVEGALREAVLLKQRDGRRIGFRWHAKQIKDVHAIQQTNSAGTGAAVGIELNLEVP